MRSCHSADIGLLLQPGEKIWSKGRMPVNMARAVRFCKCGCLLARGVRYYRTFANVERFLLVGERFGHNGPRSVNFQKWGTAK